MSSINRRNINTNLLLCKSVSLTCEGTRMARFSIVFVVVLISVVLVTLAEGQKAGQCPAVVNSNTAKIACRARANRCRDDFSCPGDLKCCRSICARNTCLQPEGRNTGPPRGIGTRPGSCPPVRPGQAGVCAELCTSDNSCPGRQKCCSNGCGRSCV